MNLINLLPDIYADNMTMKELQDILSENINTLTDNLGETIDECFVNTASALLSRYERIYGIQVDVNKTVEFRRERIRAKIRGIGTVTKQMLIDVASSYSNGEVEIIEDPANNSFKIKFIGTKGLPANMADLILTIEEIKPAHLTYAFEYTYLTWNEFDNYNKTFDEWDELNLTWNEFESYREVI